MTTGTCILLTQKLLLGFSRKIIEDLPEYSNSVVFRVVAILVVHVLCGAGVGGDGSPDQSFIPLMSSTTET